MSANRDTHKNAHSCAKTHYSSATFRQSDTITGELLRALG